MSECRECGCSCDSYSYETVCTTCWRIAKKQYTTPTVTVPRETWERMQRKAEMMDMIDYLRADEGESLELVCDNPDFNGMPNCFIVSNGEWTGWNNLNTSGDSLYDCLKRACQTKKATPSSAVEEGSNLPNDDVNP